MQPPAAGGLAVVPASGMRKRLPHGLVPQFVACVRVALHLIVRKSQGPRLEKANGRVVATTRPCSTASRHSLIRKPLLARIEVPL